MCAEWRRSSAKAIQKNMKRRRVGGARYQLIGGLDFCPLSYRNVNQRVGRGGTGPLFICLTPSIIITIYIYIYIDIVIILLPLLTSLSLFSIDLRNILNLLAVSCEFQIIGSSVKSCSLLTQSICIGTRAHAFFPLVLFHKDRIIIL